MHITSYTMKTALFWQLGLSSQDGRARLLTLKLRWSMFLDHGQRVAIFDVWKRAWGGIS